MTTSCRKNAQVSPVLLFALALAISTEVADAKGGGGHGSGGKSSSSSSKSSSSKSSSSSSKGSSSGGAPIVIVGSGSSRRCYDQDGKLIPCPKPSKKTAIIVGSVIAGVVGLTLLSILILWILRRRKQRRSIQETPIKPIPASRKNTKEKDYQRLEDPPMP